MTIVYLPMFGQYHFFEISTFFYPSNKDIKNFTLKKKLDILVGYQIFTFFNLIWMSTFPYICYSFISQISTNLDIKFLKFAYQLCWVLGFFWANFFPKGNIFFLKGNILSQIFFYKIYSKKIIN
jgi:hypothetical protein